MGLLRAYDRRPTSRFLSVLPLALLFATSACTSPETEVGMQVMFVSPALIGNPNQVEYLRLRIDAGSAAPIERVYQGAAAAALVRDCTSADVSEGAVCNPSIPDQIIEVPSINIPTGRDRVFSAIVFFNTDPAGTDDIEVYSGASPPTDVLSGALTVSINTALLAEVELSGQVSCSTATVGCAMPLQREHAAVVVTDVDTGYEFPLFNAFCTSPAALNNDLAVDCAGGEVADGGYYAVRLPQGRDYSVRAMLNGLDSTSSVTAGEAGRFVVATTTPTADPTNLDLAAATPAAFATVTGQVLHSNGSGTTVGLQNGRVTLEQLSFNPFTDPADTYVFQFVANLGAATSYVVNGVPPGTHDIAAEFVPTGDTITGTVTIPPGTTGAARNFTFLNVSQDAALTFPAGFVPGDLLGGGGLAIGVVDFDADTDGSPGTDALSGLIRNTASGETEVVTFAESAVTAGQFVLPVGLATALGTGSDGNDTGTLIVRSGQGVELVVTDPIAFNGQTNAPRVSNPATVNNRAPVLGLIADPSVPVGQGLALPTVTASDPDAPVDALSFSVTGALPSGVSLVDNGDGTADWQGTPSAVGTFNATVSVSDNGVPSLSDSQAVSFTVNAVGGGPAVQLIITTQPPASVSADGTFGLTVEARDGSNVLDTNYSGTVTAAAVGGSGSLSGATAVVASGGIVTFSGLSYTAAEPIQIQVTAGGLASDTSAGMSVTHGAAMQLAFTAQPLDGTTDDRQTVAVEVRDTYGNLVDTGTDSTVSIDLTIGTNPGGASLIDITAAPIPNLSVAALAGVATFSAADAVQLDKVAVGYDLQAGATLSGPGAVNAFSNSFMIDHGVADHLAFGTFPQASETAGAPWATFTVEIRDSFGNVTTSDGSTAVTLLGDGTAANGGFSGNVATVTAGVADFAGVVYLTAETFNLGAAGAALPFPLPLAITIDPDTADHLSFGVPPPSATQRGVVWSFFTVEVRDTYENLLGGDNATQIAVQQYPSANPLGGTATRQVMGGRAVFNDVAHGLDESIQVVATAGGLIDTAPVNVDVRSGPQVLLEGLERVTLSDAGGESNGISAAAALSRDGRYLAFGSDATNLVVGDGNGFDDIFVRDLLAEKNERISVDTAGADADGLNVLPAISADGRYVVFLSAATDLVVGDTNGLLDVFVRDRLLGQTKRVSVDSAGAQTGDGSAIASRPAISADGRFVAFISDATTLVPADANSLADVFVHDQLTGQTVRVNVDSTGAEAAGGPSAAPAISADGRFVAFASSAANLVVGDGNGLQDVFLHDRDVSGNGVFDEFGDIATVRVSADTGGSDADGLSTNPSITDEGRFIAFESDATDLIAGDTNGFRDIFIYDRVSGKTRRASASSIGAESDNHSYFAAIAPDGTWVAYESAATNLDWISDFNGQSDIYVTDLIGSATHLISAVFSFDAPISALGDGDSFGASLARSTDTFMIAFSSVATNLDAHLPDTNGQQDLFVFQIPIRETGGGGDSIRRVSLDEFGNEALQASGDVSISQYGDLLAFTSLGALVTGDGNGVQDVYVTDGDRRTPILISRTPAGSAGNAASGTNDAPAISRNGRFVVFDSDATDLSADPDTGVATDVFIRDLLAGVTEKISVDDLSGESDAISALGAVSDDGRYVAFASQATDILPIGTDTNGWIDTFVRDRFLGITERVSLQDAGAGGGEADGDNLQLAMSADGRFVAFVSGATNLLGAGGDLNGFDDIYVRDRMNGTTERVSVQDIAAGGGEANGGSDYPAISADGRYVAFESDADNLLGVGADLNVATDIFVHDRMTGATELVSVDSLFNPLGSDSNAAAISDDGRFVAFHTQSAADAADVNGVIDVYVHDRVFKLTGLASVDYSGTAGNQTSQRPALSGDGLVVAFESTASNFDFGDSNAVQDVFAVSNPLTEGVSSGLPNQLASVSDVTSGSAAGNGSSHVTDFSPMGRFIVFSSQSTNLDPSDVDAIEDLFVFDRGSQRTVLVSLNGNSVKSNGASTNGAIDRTGRYVAFESLGTNLAVSDGNGFSDVFVKDLLTGEIKRVSEAFGGGDSNGASGKPDLSMNGRIVVFESDATDLLSVAESGGSTDVYAFDLKSGAVERVSNTGVGGEPTGNSANPSVSATGRYVAYESSAADIVVGDSNAAADVFVYDRLTKTTVRASVDSFGAQAAGVSGAPSLAAGGDRVAFHSSANNLVSPATTPGRSHIYVHDLGDGATFLASVTAVGIEGDAGSFNPSLNGFGEIVAFESDSGNLSRSLDGNGVTDVFVKNLRTGSVDRASFVQGIGIEADGGNTTPVVAPFDPYVAFDTTATNLLTGTPGEIAGNPDVVVMTLPFATMIDPLFKEAPGSPLAAGTNPVRLAAGDIDRDGKPDLVIANNVGGSMSVFLGDGAGGFADVGSIPSGGPSPSDLALADFDRDGDLDLAVVLAPSNAVGLFLGDGTGGFAAAPGSPFAVGTSPQALAVGDFDRNGALDIATANMSTNSVVVLLGDGAGGFPSSTPTTVGGAPNAIAAADFNEDGVLDVVVPTTGTGVNVHLGDGAGGFTPAPGNPYAMSGSGISWIAAGRLDGDAAVDIVTANATSDDISVRLGTGTGDFGGVMLYLVGTTPRSVALADFDLDGVLDVATGNDASGNVSVLYGDGSGGFFDDYNSPYDTDAQTYGIAVADFDLNARPDLASANLAPNNATVLLNQSKQDFARWLSDDGFPPVSVSPSTGLTGLASGDFDRDGDVDLAVAASVTDEVGILENLGGGNFVAYTTLGASAAPQRLAVGDVNRDGDPDLVVANGGALNTVDVFTGAPGLGFNAGSGPLVGVAQTDVLLADFDRDGLLDLAVTHSSDQLSILQGDGIGNFADFIGSPLTLGNSLAGLAAADVDRDGTTDLLIADDSTGEIAILLGNGSGGFVTAPASPLLMPAGGVPVRLTVGDFNRDGAVDVAAAINGATDNPVFFGDGAGDFPSNFTLGLGDTNEVVATDFDLDGNPDLVFGNVMGSEVKVLLGDGAGGFSPLLSGPYGVGGATGGIVVRVLEGDAYPEAAVVDASADQIRILFNRSF